MKKICIISNRHISYNPRVLKEADALHNAGFSVVVVTVNNHFQQSRFDDELMKERSWKLLTVNFRKSVKNERMKWIKLSLQNKIYGQLKKISLRHGIAERAADKAYNSLKKIAINEKADLYIAHHAETLGIAYSAAQLNQAKWGFDAEDFHSGMEDSYSHSGEKKIIEFLENKYLGQCDYITASSRGIGEAYKKKYNLLQDFTVILNAFPLVPLQIKTVAYPIKFYWYSQVIGPTRGLEQLVIACGKLKGNFELHLRGTIQNDTFKLLLLKLAKENNVEDKIYFHEPILADEIITNAVQFDVGLALESHISLNKKFCVANKIFAYLMSGLAIVGTDTYGQKDIFKSFPGAVKECKMDDPTDLARAMQYFIDHPGELQFAKKSAREAAEQQFNWELESNKFIKTIEGIFENEKNLNHFSTLPTI